MPKLKVHLDDFASGNDLDLEIEIDDEDVKILNGRADWAGQWDYVMNLLGEQLGIEWKVVE